MNSKLPSKHDVTFLLAEDLRTETGGKFSLVGFIPGDRIGVQGEPPPGVAFALPSITFIFLLAGPSTGHFKGQFRIVAPDKKTVVADMALDRPIDKVAGRIAMFGAAAKPFIGPALGTYTVHLDLGKARFKFPLTVEKATNAKKEAKPQ